MATPVWLTGFEHGVLSSSGGGLFNAVAGTVDTNIAIDSSTKRSGSYSLRCYPGSSTACNVAKTVSTNLLVGRYYVRFSSLPTADVTLSRGIHGTGSCNLGYSYNSGNPRFYATHTSGSAQYTAAGSVSAGVWYRLDFRADVSGTTHYLDWQVDGAAQTQATRGSASAQTIGTFAIGIAMAGVADLNIDDVIIGYTTGDYPFGAGSIVGLSPDVDGSHDPDPVEKIYEDGDNLISGSYPAYSELSQVPLSSTTGYIKQTSADTGDFVQVAFADTTKSTINGVSAILAYMSSAASPANQGATIIMSSATQTDVYGNPTTRADMGESSMFYKSAIVTPGSSPWTQSQVNNLYCNMGYSNDVAPVPYWENLMLEVDGPDATGATVAISAPITGVISTLAPTVIKQEGKTVVAAVVTGALSAITASARMSRTAQASVISSRLSTLQQSQTGSANTVQQIVSGKISASGMTASVSTTYVPSPITGLLTNPAATASGGESVSITATPPVVTGTFSAIAATVRTIVRVVVSVIQASITTLPRVVTASALVIPAVIVGNVTAMPATAISGGNITVSAQLVTGKLSASGMTASVSTTYVPEIVSGTPSTLPATVPIQGSKTVQADLIVGRLFASQVDGVDVGVTADVGVIVLSGTAPTATAGTSNIVSVTVGVGVVTGSLSTRTPTENASARASAGLISGTFTAFTPVVLTGRYVEVQVPCLFGSFQAMPAFVGMTGGRTVYPVLVTGKFTPRNPRVIPCGGRKIWFKVRGNWVQVA